jgi:hypothetical protein
MTAVGDWGTTTFCLQFPQVERIPTRSGGAASLAWQLGQAKRIMGRILKHWRESRDALRRYARSNANASFFFAKRGVALVVNSNRRRGVPIGKLRCNDARAGESSDR